MSYYWLLLTIAEKRLEELLRAGFRTPRRYIPRFLSESYLKSVNESNDINKSNVNISKDGLYIAISFQCAKFDYRNPDDTKVSRNLQFFTKDNFSCF